MKNLRINCGRLILGMVLVMTGCRQENLSSNNEYEKFRIVDTLNPISNQHKRGMMVNDKKIGLWLVEFDSFKVEYYFYEDTIISTKVWENDSLIRNFSGFEANVDYPIN